MNNISTNIASFFTGKGSAIRIAIIGSLLAGTTYEILDSQYSFQASTKDSSISLTPAGGNPTLPVRQESPVEQITDVDQTATSQLPGEIPQE